MLKTFKKLVKDIQCSIVLTGQVQQDFYMRVTPLLIWFVIINIEISILACEHDGTFNFLQAESTITGMPPFIDNLRISRITTRDDSEKSSYWMRSS